MRRTIVFLAMPLVLGGAVIWSPARTASAQVVDVAPDGGVHVRAPFVSVDVLPGGGVSVRAPFTAVDIPGRGYRAARRPVIVAPRRGRSALPTPPELAAMDDQTLRRALRFNADRLHVQLGQFDTGDTWRRYLLAADEVLAEFASRPDDRPEALAQLLERFRVVIDEDQYAMIAELPAFQAMQAALSEALARVDDTPAASAEPDEELPLPPPQAPQLQLPPPQR